MKAPEFPEDGDVTKFLMQLSISATNSAPFSDMFEVTFIGEVREYTIEELGQMEMSVRATRLDKRIASVVGETIKSSGHPVVKDFERMCREINMQGKVPTGRQIARLLWDTFKTDMETRDQDALEDLSQLRWLGDDRLWDFYNLSLIHI